MRSLMIISIIFALFLSVVPVPFEWRLWRPEFLAIIVVYWSMYYPQHFGLLPAWSCGILLDIIELSPLGYNALGLVVIAYISQLSYQRIRSYTLWQQAGWVFVLVGIYQLISNWASGFFNKDSDTPEFLVAAAITAFLWPLVVVCFRTVNLRYRIPQK